MSSEVQNILVRSPNWIGDQILSYPFFVELRKKFPNAHITVACVSWVAPLQFRALVNEVLVLPSNRALPPLKRFWQLDRFSKSLRQTLPRPWDLAFSLPNSFSAAWFLWRVRARTRVGYAHEARSLLLNQKMPWSLGESVHRSLAYLKLISPENSDVDWPTFFKKNPVKWPFEKPPSLSLSSLGLEKKMYWVLGPGATASSRRWDVNSYEQVVTLLLKKTGMKAVIVGGEREKPLAEYLLQTLPEACVDLTGQTAVTDLAPLFEGACVTLTNESGLAHVASFFGSPVVIVCGAADPKRTTPIGPGSVTVLTNPVECWPCERNQCYQQRSKYLQCLRGIYPERVFEATREYF